jgi:hypothetical protein
MDYLSVFKNTVADKAGLGWAKRAPASWTAAALCRFSIAGLAAQGGRGLPQSKTSRNFPDGLQKTVAVLLKQP